MFAHYCLLALLLGSVVCWYDAPPVQQPKRTLANTVWVPRTIAWQRPFPHDAELRRIQYAAFTLLSFQAQGRCLLISSYHSRGAGDTIIVATEPGIRLDSGHYRIEPQQDVITSNNVYRTLTSTRASQQKDARTDTLSFKGQALLYKGLEYRPYTKLSGRSVDSFWASVRAK